MTYKRKLFWCTSAMVTFYYTQTVNFVYLILQGWNVFKHKLYYRQKKFYTFKLSCQNAHLSNRERKGRRRERTMLFTFKYKLSVNDTLTLLVTLGSSFCLKYIGEKYSTNSNANKFIKTFISSIFKKQCMSSDVSFF